jgi:hypothetical protein
LRENLAYRKVKCDRGVVYSLKQIFLSRDEFKSEINDYILFVNIPDSANFRWDKLKCFDVNMKKDIRFYLRCLKRLKKVNILIK